MAGWSFSLGTPVSSTNWPPQYNWNIVESGIKHHNANSSHHTLWGRLYCHPTVVYFYHKSHCNNIYHRDMLYSTETSGTKCKFIYNSHKSSWSSLSTQRTYREIVKVCGLFEWRRICHKLLVCGMVLMKGRKVRGFKTCNARPGIIDPKIDF